MNFSPAISSMKSTPLSAVSSGLDQMFEALIRASQQDGELRADLPPAQLVHMFQFLYLGTTMRWLALPGSDLRCEFDTVLGVFLRGLIASTRGTKK